MDRTGGGDARVDRMEMALLNALGKTRKMYETVNLEELVEKAGLLGLQPPEASAAHF